MATVNIQVELDWFNEGDNLDQILKDEVLSNLENRLIYKAESQITEKLNKTIAEMAERVTDSFLEETLKAKIDELKIPYKESYYSSEIKMVPIAEFIGMNYEKFLTKKTLTSKGEKPRYSNDATTSISEYFINNHLEKELSSKVSAMIQTARKDAEETIVKALENNLKEQLSVDIINRLNIPQMLESLQNKASELGEGDEE